MDKLAQQSPSLESLLTEFLNQGRSEQAFARLMKEAGGMVYGSILRRTLDPQLAEEVTQNVFIILAHKADKLHKHTSLAAWLFQTARFETEKVLRTNRRRQQYHQKFSQLSQDNTSQPSMIANEQLGLLDQSIDALKSKDRELVILRHLEGKSFKEIAHMTNLSEGACKMRLQRTLERMSQWLKQKGCTLSITALASLFASERTRACPISITQATSNILSQGSPTSSTAINYRPTENTLFGIKPIAALLTVACLTTAGIFAYRSTNHPSTHNTLSQSNSSKSSHNTKSDSSHHQNPQSKSPQISGPLNLTNYPYAFERLEELYQDFPLLRPKTPRPKEPVPHVFIEIENQINELPGPKTLDPEMQKMLSGESPWDQELITQYLSRHENRIKLLHSYSLLNPMPMHEDFRVKNSSSGHPFGPVQTMLESSAFLRLAYLHSQSTGDYEQAKNDFLAYQHLGRNIGQNGIIYELFEQRILQTAWQDAALLQSQSHDVSAILPLLEDQQSETGLIQALRYEFGAMVSLFEFLRTSENSLQIASQIFGGSVSSKQQGSALLQAMMTTTFQDLEYDYARINSALVERLQSEEPLPLHAEIMTISQEQFSQMSTSNALLLQTFMPTITEPLSQITQGLEERKAGLPDELPADLHATSGEFPVKIDPELNYLFSFDPVTGQFTFPAPPEKEDPYP